MIDDGAIEGVLDQVAAAHDRLEPGVWRAVIPSYGRSFRLFVKRTGTSVRLEVPLFLRIPEAGDALSRLYHELLCRNRTLTEARFAIDEDDEVLVEAVLDARSAPDALAAAVDGLVTAIDAHMAHLDTL